MIEPEQITQSMRLIMVMLWALILIGGFDSIIRIVDERVRLEHDLMDASLTLISAGILIFGFSALAGRAHMPPDWITATSLMLLDIGALGILGKRAMRAPAGHRGAALASTLSILALAFVTGIVV